MSARVPHRCPACRVIPFAGAAPCVCGISSTSNGDDLQNELELELRARVAAALKRAPDDELTRRVRAWLAG